ncbi:hypothetical protein MASR1M101_12460 [Gemmatimonas sp.]
MRKQESRVRLSEAQSPKVQQYIRRTEVLWERVDESENMIRMRQVWRDSKYYAHSGE